MATPPDASYKLRQRAPHPITFHETGAPPASGRLSRVLTRAGREYVIDPVTGQWWRADTWRGRHPGGLP